MIYKYKIKSNNNKDQKALAKQQFKSNLNVKPVFKNCITEKFSKYYLKMDPAFLEIRCLMLTFYQLKVTRS